MFSLIEVLNFRCLRYVRQPLQPFHVLVGPNATGKSAFLDVIAFLGRMVSDGIEAAVEERTRNFRDLIWQQSERRLELAIEAAISGGILTKLGRKEFDVIRYEVSLGTDGDTHEVGIFHERALLKKAPVARRKQRALFPGDVRAPETILAKKRVAGTRTVLNKVPGGNDNFYSEVRKGSGRGWAPAFKLGPRKSTLANLPEDDTNFPVCTWLKRILAEGVRRLALNSEQMRKASPPGRRRTFAPDGSNLPWAIEDLRKRSPKRFKEWVAHLQTALPDLERIRTVERPEDRHRYLIARYKGGLEVPSWMVSDGTLRLLALTLPAYLPSQGGIYLIEEPENGIHPRAVETVFQSLSSVYDIQILMATHSPVILSLAEPSQILCFAKTAHGATDIIVGADHPALKDWRGETNLGTLYAGGVLG